MSLNDNKMKGADNMKNKQNEVSRLKWTLLKKRRDGVRQVIWRVDSKAQKDEVLRLGFSMEPWLYEIWTRPFKFIKDKPSLMKDVHYAYKRGKKCIVRHLTKRDVELLKEFDVYVRVIKYKITLIC